MTPSPTNTSVPSLTAKDKNRPNRARLSVACNQVWTPCSERERFSPSDQSSFEQCRKRKVRCDASLPKCRNCVLRKEDCETSHPRHPWKGPSFRTLVNKNRHAPIDQNQSQPNPLEDTPIDNEIPACSNFSQEPSAAIRSPQQRSVSDAAVPIDDEPRSWISRAYRDTAATDRANDDDQDSSTPELVVNTDATPYRVKVRLP